MLEFLMNLPPSISGIYTIRCKLDKRMYVGSSVNMRKRAQNHLSALRKGSHHSRHLQRAWDKYGPDYFEIFVLERVPKEYLPASEQDWLDSATCAFNGSRLAYRFEQTPESRAISAAKLRALWEDPEYKSKMLEAFKNGKKPVIDYSYAATPEHRKKLQVAHRPKHRIHQAFGKLWCLKELAEEYGVHYGMLKDRVRSGWDVERAVTTPKRKGGL